MTFLEIIVPSLYGLSMVVLLVYALNLYWLSVRSARTERLLPGSPGQNPHAALTKWPRVTVQLPVFNEPHVVERLIDVCSRLDYPRHLLEIQVLDDSTDHTIWLARTRVEYWRSRGVDIVHVQRKNREGFKAGALANGLRFAAGDFIAVFDADFLPERDFLRRLLPHFDTPDVGMVQARWAHLNERDSMLTRVQAFGLDTHFALEQRVRCEAGCFINFNGTAGVWRRSCIEDAGGWSAATLTEDLDLSYRAQLAGWRLKYVNEHEVTAELPAFTSAFRSQQFRWAKGSLQTAIRILPALWGSSLRWRVKAEGSLHLSAHLVFPFVVLAGLLHPPLMVMKAWDRGPGEIYFALLGIGLMGLAGFFLAQLYAQRSLYPDWRRRLRIFPVFMAGTMGMSINNSIAVWQAIRGLPSGFVRTPKSGVRGSRRPMRRATLTSLPAVVFAEMAAALYCGAGSVVIAMSGQWAAVPFQVLLTWGFGMVVWFSVADRTASPNRDTAFDDDERENYLAPVFSLGDRSQR